MLRRRGPPNGRKGAAGMEATKKKSLPRLFWGLFTISAFTFGGGFVIVTFLKKRFVDAWGWIDENEMTDYIALAQSTPGSIMVNAAILLGWNTLGFPGMIAAVLGAVLPPMLILGVISVFYAAFAENRVVALLLRGMQAGVAAVILDAALNMGGKVIREKSALGTALMAGAFGAAFFLKVNVMLLIGLALAVGVAQALLARRGKGARP